MHTAKAAALVLALCCSCVPSDDPRVTPPSPDRAERPPSVLVILTDDQRRDTMSAMPVVRGQIAAPGVRFTRAYVTNPSCCPSRVSLLTAAIAHHRRLGEHRAVRRVRVVRRRADRRDLARRRRLSDGAVRQVPERVRAGIRLRPSRLGRVARRVGSTTSTTRCSTRRTAKAASSRTATSRPGTRRVLTRRAETFLASAPADTPFFAVVAYHAPHPPATPDPRDASAPVGLAPHRPPSFDERDVSDKPGYVRGLDPLDRTDERALDAFRRDQLRSLLAVDRAVGRLLSTLRTLGRLEETMVVFTSDNGYEWGEHRWVGKGVPYGDSIRVPLVVRFNPLVASPGSRSRAFALGIDLAPTIAEVAGVSTPQVDGRSLVPLLRNPDGPFRDRFIVEHAAEATSRPSFCALRLGRWAYVRTYTDGLVSDVELYDLGRDPFQLRNRAEDAPYAATLETLETEADERCVPPPVG